MTFAMRLRNLYWTLLLIVFSVFTVTTPVQSAPYIEFAEFIGCDLYAYVWMSDLTSVELRATVQGTVLGQVNVPPSMPIFPNLRVPAGYDEVLIEMHAGGERIATYLHIGVPPECVGGTLPDPGNKSGVNPAGFFYPGDDRINWQAYASFAVYCVGEQSLVQTIDANGRIQQAITLVDVLLSDGVALAPGYTYYNHDGLISVYGPADGEGKQYYFRWNGCPPTYREAGIRQGGVDRPTEIQQ